MSAAIEKASWLMKQSAILMGGIKGKPEISLANWLDSCDKLLSSKEELGQLVGQLSRRRLIIEGLVSDDASEDRSAIA